MQLEVFLTILRLTFISATVFTVMVCIKLALDQGEKKDETKEEK
jgi:hypothetical protein